MEELIKEVYARFGLAYYQSECLHRELCLGYTLQGIYSLTDITKPQLEERTTQAFKLTLGQVSSNIRNDLPPELQTLLDEAITLRNYIAHHFWYEECQLLFTPEGLESLIEKLVKWADNFEYVDDLFSDYFEKRRQEIGIPDELIQQYMEKLVKGEPTVPLPDKRPTRNRETIVRAWEAPNPRGGSILILETEDGELLTFGHGGLAWSLFNTKEDDWIPIEKINQLLPSTVIAKPKGQDPWNYAISISDSLVIQIAKDPQSKTVKCKFVYS